jgi:hypothetical protein
MSAAQAFSAYDSFRRLIAALSAVCLVSGQQLGAQSGDDFREWTNLRGEVIEARIVRENPDGTIRLLRRDGWQGDVPLSLFSEADRRWVELQRTASEISAAVAKQSESFEILSMRRTQSSGFVSTPEGWEHRVDGIQAEVRYKGAASSVSAYAKAYFFDGDGKLVGNFEKAPRRQTQRNSPYIEAPESFGRDRKEELFFPITRAISDAKWRAVLIVFGTSEEASARTIPSNANLLAFGFPEKKLIFPEWNEELAQAMAGGTPPPPPAGTDAADFPGLELRRIQKAAHRHATRFNDSWQSGRLCLSGEIRSNNRPPAGSLSVAAFFFDEGKRLVESRNRPSMTNIGEGTHVGIPDIARTRQWYPFFFALDGVLESANWHWAVVYAEADGEGTASLFGPQGATIKDLSFPGKEKLRTVAAETSAE